MAGARDTDWTHIHVVGDRDAAAPYVSYARKLLGYVKQDAGYNGLMTHGVERQLSDGAVIRAEIVGGIPRITINPPGGGSDVVEADWFEGVVILSQAEQAFPTIAVEEAEIRNQGTVLVPLFISKSTPLYNGATTPKGVWTKVQPELKATLQPALLSGEQVEAAQAWRKKMFSPFQERFAIGGITHTNTDGDSVVYIGTLSDNYFYFPFRCSAHNGGRYVFHRGKVVFSTEVLGLYGSHNETWRVYGAAMKDDCIYVVVSAPLYEADYPIPDFRSQVSNPDSNAWIAPPYYVGVAPVKVLKVNLRTELDEKTAHVNYVYSDYEVLYEGNLHNADGPWMFDDEVTHAVCIARPDECRLTWTAGIYDDEDAFFRANVIQPSETHLRHYFDIDTRSMNTSDAGDVIAEGNGKTLRIERVAPCKWDYVWDGGRVAAFYTELSDQGAVSEFVSRRLVFADPKHDRFIFSALESTAPEVHGSLPGTAYVEIFDSGVRSLPGVYTRDQMLDGSLPPGPAKTTQPQQVYFSAFGLDETCKRLSRMDKISAAAFFYMYSGGRTFETQRRVFVNPPLTGWDMEDVGASRAPYTRGGIWMFYGRYLEGAYDLRRWQAVYTPLDNVNATKPKPRRVHMDAVTPVSLGAALSDGKGFFFAAKVKNNRLGTLWLSYASGVDLLSHGLVRDWRETPWAVTRWGAPPKDQKKHYVKGATT